jgi:flagellar biosynthesis protein FlhB
MSNEDAQERTEAPTAKKLEDARKKGQVPRSVDLGAAAVTLAATGALLLFGADAAGSLMEISSTTTSCSAVSVHPVDWHCSG